jgi:hypothetical protein
LKNLSSASAFAEMKPVIEALSAKEKPKKAWERKRGAYRGWTDAGVGRIEYEFGGAGEAYLRKHSLLPGQLGSAYEPTCLDDILRGGVGEVKMQSSLWGGPPIAVDTVTNMRRLQFLFGIHRDRFRKKVEGRRLGKIIVRERCGSVIPIFVIVCSVE